MPYIICTDSSCDLSPSYIDAHPLKVLGLMYTINGETFEDDNFRAITPKSFYDRIRQGQTSKTTLINTERYVEFFTPILQQGEDILYVGFSSGLSGSVQSAMIAANQLKEQFPQRDIRVVDTLAASLGQGLLVHYALANQSKGMSLADNAKWLEDHKLNLAHWFTVDDLNHLRRGGRISATTAILGTMLSIKPVMHMDNEGHLIAMSKTRGRKQSLKALVEEMGRLVVHPEAQDIFISHGDCLEDAQYVGSLIQQRFPVQSITYHEVGPVIGSHTGPGVVALFFMGDHR